VSEALGRLEVYALRFGFMICATVGASVAASAVSLLLASEADRLTLGTFLANTINSSVAAQDGKEQSWHALQKAWDLMLTYRIRYQEWPDRVEVVANALHNLEGSTWHREARDDPWVPALCGLLLDDPRTTLKAVGQLASRPTGGFCGNALAAENVAFHELEAWAHFRLGDYDSTLKAVAAAESERDLADIDVGSQRWALLWGVASVANDGQGHHSTAIDFARRASAVCAQTRRSWNLYYESDPQVEREVCSAIEKLVKTLGD
jgi:hypothetical protein